MCEYGYETEINHNSNKYEIKYNFNKYQMLIKDAQNTLLELLQVEEKEKQDIGLKAKLIVVIVINSNCK